MATSSQLEDRMCCQVCMETYDNQRHVPKLLPCQHTFCQACIVQSTNQNSLPASLQCPICRSHHVIPQGGFVTHRFVLEIVDELQKDVPIKSPNTLKCKKHSNKEVVYVCIDCLDTFCTTCAKSSIHMRANHHVEEVDEAVPVLQQKFQSRQSSIEKNLSLLEKSPCSSTELAKAEADIKSLAKKIHVEATKWESEQLSMVQEMRSFENAQKKKKKELNSIDNDLNTFLLKMTQYQPQSDVDDDFMNKLYQRQAEDQSRFDQSLKTLLNKLRAEIESISAIQSKYLKKAASMTSAVQGSYQSVARETKDKHQVAIPKQVAESKVPQGTKVLYKVRVVDPNPYSYAIGYLKVNTGDVIAVTEECGGGFLYGIHERSGKQGAIHKSIVERIK